MTKMKVLNLYAGIGGNRKLWRDVDVTAVERDEDIARVYQNNFPEDEVIVDDAHEYLKEHYHEFDYIWSSPPCHTHSRMRKVDAGHNSKNPPVYPDLSLYEEILFLQGYFDGRWVVENVDPYYDEMIQAQKRHRHLFWSNFHIPKIDLPADKIRYMDNQEWREKTGFDIRDEKFEEARRDQIRHNTMNPKLGKHVFEAAKTEEGSLMDI